MYQLGVEELAEQERHVAEIRSRPPALLAAGAVVASLLAKAVFSGPHPRGWEVPSAVVGILGGIVLLGAALLILMPYEMGFSLDAGFTYRWLFSEEITEQPGVDLVLADALHERRATNQKVVEADHLSDHLGPGVVGRSHWLCRRRSASLLTRMPDQPKRQPSSAPKIPAPGSLPKLPQTAFNLEKRGDDTSGRKRST